MPSQKPNLKKAFVQETYVQKAQALADKAARKLFGATVSLQKARDLVQNNYDLGLTHLASGNIKDAVMRLKLVVWLDPGHAGAWYNLGRAYLADDKRAQSVSSLKRALKLKPGYEEAAYMLAIAMGGAASSAELPKKIPLSIALSFFEALADDYNIEELEILKYQGHTLLASALRGQMMEGRMDHVVLDLGVGTGLCGPGLRDVSASITGVDFSPKMLEQAMQVKDSQGRKIYDALVNRELHDFLKEVADQSVDVVMAAKTFSYVGDLREIFQQSARVLKRGGLFAFIVEKSDGPDFRFDTELGRFRYSKDYLKNLASMAGFSERLCEMVDVYPDTKMWLCVYAK